MLVCDTNVLFPALEASHPNHSAARVWLESMVEDESFALCELVLTEVYTLLRNASICAKPLSAAAAVAVIENLRSNPAWLVLDYPGRVSWTKYGRRPAAPNRLVASTTSGLRSRCGIMA